MNIRQKVKKWLYGNCPGFAGSFPYFKTKTYFPPNSLVFTLACEQGIYEADSLSLILSLVKEDTVYFDVGANIGMMSIPVLHNKQNVRVISIEPSPNTLPYLQKTAKKSVYRDRWVIVGKAVGETKGAIDFFVASPELGAFDGRNDTKRAGETRKVVVEMTTIDYEWELLGCPDVSLLKIDVEGAETSVIHGATNCIKSTKPYILIEWNIENLNANNCNPNTILELAKNANYEIYSVPNLVHVVSGTDLHLQMLNTENFLLAPN